MAEVVRWVFEEETETFGKLMDVGHVGSRVADWPALLWEVFSRPSGVAVLEILVASRSDPELAAPGNSTWPPYASWSGPSAA